MIWANLYRVGRAVAGFWTERGLPSESEGDVLLAVERLANVILHEYRDQGEYPDRSQPGRGDQRGPGGDCG